MERSRRSAAERHRRTAPEKIERNARRKKALTSQVPAWADRTAAARYYRAAEMLRQIGLAIVVDHYLPLRGREVCGLHVADNLRLADAAENARKGAALPDDTHVEGPLMGQFVRVEVGDG